MTLSITPDTTSNRANELIELFKSRHGTIAVVGMGYVGLPMALEFCKAGFRTIGVDVDEERCVELRSGRSYISDVSDADVAEAFASGRFEVTTEAKLLADCNAILICVPTPLSKTKDPDLSAILSAGKAVSSHLQAGQLVVLESTTYPGTTQEVLQPMLEATGLTEGVDFYLAFSPERVDPGNAKFGVSNITKLVGGCTAEGTEVAATLYEQMVSKVIRVSNPRVAEAAKLLENTFRSINIGLANEMAIICKHLGIDVWEVISAASTKPFGFMPHYPGPGIGGHCIPLDPHYLAWKVRLRGYEPRLIRVASLINAEMPRHVVELINDGLNDIGKSIRNSKIVVLGVAYKPHVSDMRESPAVDIMHILAHKGAVLSYCDPYVPSFTAEGTTMVAQPLTPELIASADCVVVTTHHSEFDYKMVAEKASLVIDTRNATRKHAKNGNIRFI